MLNHLLHRLVSFSSLPHLLSLPILLPPTLISSRLLSFPFKPVFFQILLFSSQQKKVNPPFIPYFVISSRHIRFTETPTGQCSRDVWRLRCKIRRDGIDRPSCCGPNKTGTKKEARRSAPPDVAAVLCLDVAIKDWVGSIPGLAFCNVSHSPRRRSGNRKSRKRSDGLLIKFHFNLPLQHPHQCILSINLY